MSRIRLAGLAPGEVSVPYVCIVLYCLYCIFAITMHSSRVILAVCCVESLQIWPPMWTPASSGHAPTQSPYKPTAQVSSTLIGLPRVWLIQNMLGSLLAQGYMLWWCHSHHQTHLCTNQVLLANLCPVMAPVVLPVSQSILLDNVVHEHDVPLQQI